MATRARIAQASDLQSVRERRPKRLARPTQIVALRLAVLSLLVASIHLSARFLGVGFNQDQAEAVVAFLARAGAWVRVALASGFQSIPVW